MQFQIDLTESVKGSINYYMSSVKRMLAFARVFLYDFLH